MGLMIQWTPVPLDVARGVVSGYIAATPNLPERLRQDHPADLDAGILAGVVESIALGRHKEAFAEAKGLLSLADDNEKKEELFKLFQQLWQYLEGRDVAECEAIATPLVAHSPRLQAVFGAAVLLRKGDADGAIRALDREKAADDIYWLQLRSSALLQKQQIGEAVELLFVVAKKTYDAGLLHKTGDLAYQAKKFDVAVWCFEHLAQIQPANLALRGSLAHIYTFVFHDLTKAAAQFRALRSAEPDNPTHTLNLAICLAQLFLPEESLNLYDEMCRQEAPAIMPILGRSQLHHGLGHQADAFASLDIFRERFWGDPSFLLAYMHAAYAAGNEEAAHEAMKALNLLQAAGKVEKEAFRAVHQDEVLEMFKQSCQQTQDRNESIHSEMLNGRMPWVWAEQMAQKPIYMGWRTRTQEMGWIGDEPANRARLCIYSTNGFHARESERGRRSLLPLGCPPAGTKVVVDLSALITLHRLGLLDTAAEYFGELMVPAGYLPTVLEDSRQMVLNQRSRQESAEQIRKRIDAESIVVLEEGGKSKIATVAEHTDTADHTYRLIDIVRPLHAAGVVSDTEFGHISPVCAKKSALDETHPNLKHLQDVVVELSTIETLARFGLLDAVTGFYKVHVRTEAHREVLQRLAAIACQEETREWHMDLWTQLRGDPRFRFVPYTVPGGMRKKDDDPKDFLPFLASFIAQETKAALMADDRVCQAFTLNEMQDVAYAAFGTDGLVLALMSAGKLSPEKAAATLRQLMVWRYRFLVPSPEVLKALADQYRGNPPGEALQDIAEYVHDCMRDPGLFGGAEKTVLGESMAARCYLSWVTAIAEFLILVWADEAFTAEAATRLTEWSARELLPSVPRVLDGRMKVRMSSITPRIFLSHAFVRTVAQSGNPRMADGMKALKEALRLNDDEYTQIAMGMLNDTVRT
jgi:tetratricopeptide (TPR) repeat protein